MITQKELKRLLTYHPETGMFTRNISTSNRVKVGDIAGRIDKNGYWQICVCGKEQRGHRLAWLYVYGEWPKKHIDHINQDRSDNRIDNLRDVSNHENHKNVRKQKNNKSGVTGVFWNNTFKKWQARIQLNGKQKHLGLYDNIENAKFAREEAKRKYNFHPNHA